MPELLDLNNPYKLRKILSKCKDILEGNSQIIMLDRVRVPWSVIVAQLNHLNDYNNTYGLDSLVSKVKHSKIENAKTDVPTNHYANEVKDVSSSTSRETVDPVKVSKIVMWLELPSVILASTAIVSTLSIVILAVTWMLTGIKAPISAFMILAMVSAVSSLLGGPTILYTEYLIAKLNTTLIENLENKVTSLGGSLND